jgi:hypothetical protein
MIKMIGLPLGFAACLLVATAGHAEERHHPAVHEHRPHAAGEFRQERGGAAWAVIGTGIAILAVLGGLVYLAQAGGEPEIGPGDPPPGEAVASPAPRLAAAPTTPCGFDRPCWDARVTVSVPR